MAGPQSTLQRTDLPVLGQPKRTGLIVAFQDTEDAPCVFVCVVYVGDSPQGFLTDPGGQPVQSLSQAFLASFCMQQGLAPYEPRVPIAESV